MCIKYIYNTYIYKVLHILQGSLNSYGCDTTHDHNETDYNLLLSYYNISIKVKNKIFKIRCLCWFKGVVKTIKISLESSLVISVVNSEKNRTYQ